MLFNDEAEIVNSACKPFRVAILDKMMQLHPARWSTTTRNWQHEPIVELNPKHHKERNVA